MTTIRKIAAAAALMATPFMAFAQYVPGNDLPSRAQVRQEQIQLEQQGYNPSDGDQASYPRDVQAAEARVGAQQVQQAESSGYGGVAMGSSASGAPVQPAYTGEATGTKPVYFGH